MASSRCSSRSRTFAASSAVFVRISSSAVITSLCADCREMPRSAAIAAYDLRARRSSSARCRRAAPRNLRASVFDTCVTLQCVRVPRPGDSSRGLTAQEPLHAAGEQVRCRDDSALGEPLVDELVEPLDHDAVDGVALSALAQGEVLVVVGVGVADGQSGHQQSLVRAEPLLLGRVEADAALLALAVHRAQPGLLRRTRAAGDGAVGHGGCPGRSRRLDDLAVYPYRRYSVPAYP
jgi:hypothetical protein